MNLNKLNMEELASYVCSQLKKKDIKVILSGGSCMELYTNALYSSCDIDFVMKQCHSIKQKNRQRQAGQVRGLIQKAGICYEVHF